jgi:hypothetical protein
MSIYGRHVPHESYRKLKLTSQAINAMNPATPEYLRWSESPITFDQIDHPDCVPKLGRFPLIVNSLVGTIGFTKALMDGDSNLNLMYLDTFEGLGLAQDQLKNNPHSFYWVVTGKQSITFRQVTLPVTFRDASNYRTEMLAFELNELSGPYHIILGRPCYVKFMAIPSYAYLKLKIPGPASTITMEAKAQ